MTALFYLQDSRTYVGNDVMWLAKTGSYTSDLSKAKVFTQEEAQELHNSRPTDIPWPKDYIDGKTRPAVDMQYLQREQALSGTGIVLSIPKPIKEQAAHCPVCGRFMRRFYLLPGKCPKCEWGSRP